MAYDMAVPQFRLARQVVDDLEEISNYIGRRNPSAAGRVVDELFRSFDLAASDPELGINLHDVRAGLWMFLPNKPAGNYLIFYYKVPDGIMISAIIHSARDWLGMVARGER